MTSLLPLLCYLATGAPASALDLEALRPTYGKGTAGALARLRARQYRDALRVLGQPTDDAGRLVAARSQFALGSFRQAARLFLALAQARPLLADHFRARAARALLNAHDADAAAREADAIHADTAALPAAMLTAAEAHLARGDRVAALARAKRFVERWPRKPAAAAALWVIRRAHRSMRRWKAARAADRRLYVDYPTSSLAHQVPAPRLKPAEALRRIRRLARVFRNRRAVREIRRLLGRRRRLTRAQRCEATFLLGRALQRLRRHNSSHRAYRSAVRICRDSDTSARALYLWGKGLLSRRRTAPAARVLERLARKHPRHRLADDGLYLAAQAWRRAGRHGRARRVLERLLRELPNGDLTPNGRFELALLEQRAGARGRAARRLEAMAAQDPARQGDLRGRPLYALGRLRDEQGRRVDAVAAYRRCAREHPLTWWASLARGRLRNLGEVPTDDRLGLLHTDVRPADLRWPRLPAALATSPAFRRGAALIRLGAGDLAGGEMTRAAREAGGTPAVLSALALVHFIAGDWYRSHRIVRWKMKAALARPLEQGNHGLFLLAYPLGYWSVIEPLAVKHKVDPLLLTALVREESAFHASIESWANAVGLGQIIWSTARRLARMLRIRRFSRVMLYDPEINLRLAAKYLSLLLRRFQGSPVLAIASYNAGELAVERWLRRRRRLDLDSFVDAIPYEQTRHYTRRVLATYAAYRYLYGEKGKRLLALGPGHPRQPRLRRRRRRRRRGRGRGRRRRRRRR